MALFAEFTREDGHTSVVNLDLITTINECDDVELVDKEYVPRTSWFVHFACPTCAPLRLNEGEARQLLSALNALNLRNISAP